MLSKVMLKAEVNKNYLNMDSPLIFLSADPTCGNTYSSWSTNYV